MNKPSFKSKSALLAGASLTLLLITAGLPAYAQSAGQNNAGQNNAAAGSAQDESSLSGSVVSATRNTMVIRLDDGTYRLYTFDQATVRPARVSPGSRVRVGSTEGDEAGQRLATTVTVEQEAAPQTRTAGSAGTAGSGPAPPNPQAVPPAIRNLERDIERNVRRYRVGVRAGVGLDPEVILVGLQAQVGPIFSPSLTFRPSVDFGFGELTSLFSLNGDFIYRLPVSGRQGRWSAYVGGGPGFTFLHQNLNTTSGGKRIDFGEFHSSTGLNIVGGVQSRGGMFAELRTSVYSAPAPTLRLIFGYNF
jgi:hypothetical protein